MTSSSSMSILWHCQNWSTTCKRMKLEHFLIPYTEINSKWIKDLNVRPETIKLLEENIGKTLSDINHSRILYDPPPRILEIKAKIDTYILSSVKQIASPGWCMRQVLRAGALGWPRGMGWGGKREGGSGWGTHVNPWLIHFNVWQKPLQYCKVISLQLIKINEKEKIKTAHGIQSHYFMPNRSRKSGNSDRFYFLGL